ncbi:MAG: toll/interleukin-1 receptor domain-containing protein [Chloroflexi bacterium]|uniref:toll/interleukin-1 receptor domain-containing protein n=1 Tax=Candidatus Flexifilum breve TaxID=3140694 RepID=UPI0031371A96|nr:toll/interleukin-1 receptor domain-containing protein [Chloroflexota bacterium]
MSTVFISYSSKDFERAIDLKQRLEAVGFTVWLDTNKLEAGSLWETEIRNAIHTCNAMVVIMTLQSSESHWVLREISYATEFGKPIIPLYVEGDIWPFFKNTHCAKSIDAVIDSLLHVPQLYVSHRPEDAEFANRLADELQSVGAKLWVGSADELKKNLGDLNVIMLLILSPEAMQSEEIRELRYAFNDPAAAKVIVPLLVRHCNVSPMLRGKPYIDFLNQNFDNAFAQLYWRLAQLGIPLQPHFSIPIPPQPPLLLDGIRMFRTAAETVWISGLILDTFAPHHERMADNLQKNPNVNVRILILKMDTRLLNEAGAWVGINTTLTPALYSTAYPGFEAWAALQDPPLTDAGRWVALRLYKNQQDLKCLKEAVSGRVEIRTTNHRPGMGYFIVDPNVDGGEGIVIASPYFYQIDRVKAESQVKYNTLPVFLSKTSAVASELWWFNQYVQEFERLWDDSEKWDPI